MYFIHVLAAVNIMSVQISTILVFALWQLTQTEINSNNRRT